MADQIELPLRILDASGDPVSGAKIYFYEAGTSTPLTVYTTEALSVAHASPLVADSGGYPARAFYSGSVAARVRIYTADDVELFDIDPAITVGVGGAAEDISFSAIPSNTATDVQAAIANITTGGVSFSGALDLNGISNPTTVVQDIGVNDLTFKNLVINGSGRVNQRGYTTAVATSGADEYTLDRWRVVTSGQSLSFTGDESGRTMTAPAGGVEQEIDGDDITETGTYVISFTGTATCTVDGTTKASGDTFTLTKGTNATIRFTSGTFTDVQVEKGTIATAFEYRPLSCEISLCERFYEVNYAAGVSYEATGTAQQRIWAPMRTLKRVTPTYSVSKVSGSATSPAVAGSYVHGAFLSFTSTARSETIIAEVTADAEI